MNDLFGNNPPVIKMNLTPVKAKPAKTDSATKPCPGEGDHKHPSHDLDKKHRHEEAYVTSSAGGEITEGCIEHYFDRIIEDDDDDVKEVAAVDTELARYIVLGEVLGKPKFKR